MLRPVVLFRPVDMDDTELEVSKKYFPTFRERTRIARDDLVIPRYSALPFFDALQADVDYVGASLINNLRQHQYVADLRNWVEDVRELTPKTWYRIEDIDESGPFILKGETNSRKGQWSSHMYAKDIQAAKDVHWRLSTDGVIGGGNQDIYIRKFVPMKTYFMGISNMPVTKEFRFFCYRDTILSGAFYWANYAEDMPEVPKPEKKHLDFAAEVLKRINGKIPFVVVDIGEKEDGEPMLVELNDGTMSGLSLNDPETLYSKLHFAIESDMKEGYL